jgi:hypothetical protein
MSNWLIASSMFRVSNGDEDEKFLWRFFLATGFREGAVAEVTDINRDTKTISVGALPDFRIQFCPGGPESQ